MAYDALRIKIRKRINPKQDNQPDNKDLEQFYPDIEGNKFYALSHFTDFFIDRITDDTYMGNDVIKYPPASPKNIKSYTLQDLILPPSNRLGKQSNYEVQFLFLSYSITDGFIYPKEYEGPTNRKIEELNEDFFKCVMVSGIKFIGDINGDKINIEKKFKELLKPSLEKLAEEYEEPLAFDIRSSLGFGDYCIITRAANFDMLLAVYHHINRNLLFDYNVPENFDENSGINLDRLKYIYTIPGITQMNYDSFVEEWNKNQFKPSDNESTQTAKKNQLKIQNKSSVHLFSKYSEDLEFITKNFPDNKVYLVLGNYDLMVLDTYISSHKKSKSWRSKSRILFELNEKYKNYYLQFISSSSNKMISEYFWDEFENIKFLNDSIGFFDQKRVLTNIHILSLEYHINLFNRHQKEDSICSRLLAEWQSILDQLISFTTYYLKKLDQKTKNSTISNQAFYKEYYFTVNQLRGSFEDTLRLINRSVRHWVIGSKSHIEFAGTENVFHFGNTAKIYNIYTKIFDEVQDIFMKMSCLCTDKKHELNGPETLNFFLVPDNQIRTTCAILFPTLTPDFSRLIAINLSTETIFNFRMIGLMMHEIGQFICHGRYERNQYLLNMFQRTMTVNLLDFVFPNPTGDTNHDFHYSFIEKIVLLNSYKVLHNKIFDLIELKTNELLNLPEDSEKNDIFLLPMLNFLEYLKPIFRQNSEKNNLNQFDYVLEDSKYFNDKISIEEDFWNKIIFDDKSTTDLISILKELPAIIENALEINVSIPEFVKYRDKFPSIEYIDFCTADEDLKNEDLLEQFFPGINYDQLSSINFAMFKHFYRIRKLIFLNFSRTMGYKSNLYQANTKFLKLEHEMIEYLRNLFVCGKVSKQTINKNKISGFSYFDFSKIDLEDFEKQFGHNFSFLTNDKTIHLILDPKNNQIEDKKIKEKFYFHLSEYIVHTYIYDEQDFIQSTSRIQLNITSLMRSNHLLSGDEKDTQKLISKYHEVLSNQRTYLPQKNAYIDRSFDNLKTESSIIQETKADYFMIRILKMNEADYIEQYLSNSDPEMSFEKYGYQLHDRVDILREAKAFDHISERDNMSFRLNEKFGRLAKVIVNSVDPVIEEFEKSEIMKACCEIFHQENRGISHDLEFIKKILETDLSAEHMGEIVK